MPAHSAQARPLHAARTWAAAAVPLGEMVAARKRVAEVFGDVLSRAMVKNLDEQSVAGLLAVHAAAARTAAPPGTSSRRVRAAVPARRGRPDVPPAPRARGGIR